MAISVRQFWTALQNFSVKKDILGIDRISRDTPISLKWHPSREEENPMISQVMLGATDNSSCNFNINGPSVIKVPKWIEKPLGQYYMYFAAHKGKYIRLAYANYPAGPWFIYDEDGVLNVDDTKAEEHIASPDILVDKLTKTIRMYFHGPTTNGQRTFLATSSDGLNFSANSTVLGFPYFRVFQFDDAYYAIGKRPNSEPGPASGVLYYSKKAGISNFERGPDIIENMRHAALYRDHNRLIIFYSRIGDEPERILKSEVRLEGNWRDWKASPAVEVLRPVENYEGIAYEIAESKGGAAVDEDKKHICLRQLRDPALLIEDDGKYLYYSIAGENGIAMAKFVPNSEKITK
jgi:hypothetical protein